MLLSELEKLIDLLRAKGVSYYQGGVCCYEGEIKLVLGPAPAEAPPVEPPKLPVPQKEVPRSLGLGSLYDHPSLGLDELAEKLSNE